MKKIVSISLFIFWAIVTAIIAAGLLFYQKDPIKPDSVSLLPSGDGPIVLNTQEIAKHSAQSDCWMIINSKVYNITSYLSAHPGGVKVITPYCGKDGEQAFVDLPHSSYANSLLVNYFLGNLNQSTSAQQIQQNSQTAAQATPPPKRRGDDDEEDD